MRRLINYLFLCLFFFASNNIAAAGKFDEQFPFELQNDFQKLLLKRVGEKLPCLVTYPFHTYPNNGHESVPQLFPNGKVPVFGYGSLMNKISAARSLKPESIDSVYPAVAFGVKRLFNYKTSKTSNWGFDQNAKEKAMLNLAQTLKINSVANGVIIEVDLEDLSSLVGRETGYDLVPILVAPWNDIVDQNGNIEVRIAYTFVATHELRNHIDYTSTEYYPVRGYLHAVQEAAQTYGDEFAQMWNVTTYLADGTTNVNDWDESTFIGILCTQTP